MFWSKKTVWNLIKKVEMKTVVYVELRLLFILFALFPLSSQAEEQHSYTINVGIEQLCFLGRPDLGYVVKSQQEDTAIFDLEVTLKEFEAEEIRPIKGLKRKGNYVVFCNRPANENIKTIKNLRANNHISYVAPLFSSNGEIVAIIPEIVVRVTAETVAEKLQRLCHTMNLTIKKKMVFTNCEYLVEVLGTDADAVFTAIEQLNQIPFIEWAAPNTGVHLRLAGQIIPSDEYFNKQWHLDNTGQTGGTPDADINATGAWEITTGDPNIIVAMLDSGVDACHPDLANNLVAGYDFADNDNYPIDILGHGTACTGLVGAEGNNGIGVAGVSWDCKIMPIRIPVGFPTPESDIAEGIRWAATNGADILSNSWHCFYQPVPIIHSAILDVTMPGGIGRNGKGCIVVFSSGNESGAVAYPAKYPEVIAVGATDYNDVHWYYSDYGPELDIVAPSGGRMNIHLPDWHEMFLWTTDIVGPAGYSTYNVDPQILDYCFMGGTSGATPIAAGVAALILSVNPNLTNSQVQLILQRSAHDLGNPGWDEYYGYGRVDARAALDIVLSRQFVFVDDDAPDDTGPGDPTISDPCENGSAEHPFDAIQEAINYAFTGGTVAVLPGTYSGDGNRDIDFGGKAITVKGKTGSDSCIIDCNGSEAEPHRGFYFHSGETSTSVLAGFTIANGNANNGGGIYIVGSSPTLTNCIFSRNSASIGGGIYNNDSNSTIANCRFSSNHATAGGGMINNNNSNPTIKNCTFTDNTASYGGGMYSWDSTPALSNCILWSDSPEEIYVYNSTPMITYSNVQGGWIGTGNIDSDPCFADPCNDDYHLLPNSVCIDSGDSNYLPEPNETDLDGHPRVADGDCNDTEIVDMGAYEFNWTYLGDFDGQCDVDFDDFAMISSAWLTEEGQPRYNSDCDISIPTDKYIDWRDLNMLGENWLAGVE